MCLNKWRLCIEATERECGKRRTQLALSFDCGNVYTTIKTSENFKFVEKKNICLSYGLQIYLFVRALFCVVFCWHIEKSKRMEWPPEFVAPSAVHSLLQSADWPDIRPAHTPRAPKANISAPSPSRFDVGSKETSWANICLVPLSQPLSLSLIICWACLPVWERERERGKRA